MSIGDDGTVVRHSGPAVYRSEDLAPDPITTAESTLPGDPGAAAIRQRLRNAALRAQLDPALVEAVAWRESGFRPQAVSSAGAVGVMQLMPAAARDLGVDRWDPGQNIDGGVAYLRSLLVRYRGDLIVGLAAYNAGPGAVDRHGGVPPFPETRAYVAAILARYAATAAPRPWSTP